MNMEKQELLINARGFHQLWEQGVADVGELAQAETGKQGNKVWSFIPQGSRAILAPKIPIS